MNLATMTPDSPLITAFAKSPADIEAMKRDAWAAYCSDYLFAVDADPACARARYDRKMAAIAELEGRK